MPSRKPIEFIVNENGCFICTSHKPRNNAGYPGLMANGRNYLMARFIYEELIGEIPEGHVIRHSCDDRYCINIEHLSTGTNADNVKDKLSRGRQPKGSEMPAAKLSENQVIKIFDSIKSGVKRKVVAEEYGISERRTYGITNGKEWKHLDLLNR